MTYSFALTQVSIQIVTCPIMGCSETSLGHCQLVEGFTWFTLVMIIMTIVLLTFLCCVCIKIRDMKLRAYIRKLAKRKGVKLELDKLDPKLTPKYIRTSQLNENCTIMVPDVAIVL